MYVILGVTWSESSSLHWTRWAWILIPGDQWSAGGHIFLWPLHFLNIYTSRATLAHRKWQGWMISTYHIQKDVAMIFFMPQPMGFQKQWRISHLCEMGAGLVWHLPGRFEFSIKLSIVKISPEFEQMATGAWRAPPFPHILTGSHWLTCDFHGTCCTWRILGHLGTWGRDWTILNLRIWSWASFPTATTLTTWQGSARTWVHAAWTPGEALGKLE